VLIAAGRTAGHNAIGAQLSRDGLRDAWMYRQQLTVANAAGRILAVKRAGSQQLRDHQPS